VFCVYCLIDTVGITTNWLYKATGRTDIMFKWGLYNAVIIIAAIIIGLKWGIMGVAISYTLSFVIFLWLPGWYFAYRLIGLKVLEMIKNIGPVFLCCVPVACLMHAVKHFLLVESAPWLSCLVIFITGISAYIIIAAIFLKQPFNIVKQLLQSKIKKVTKQFQKK